MRQQVGRAVEELADDGMLSADLFGSHAEGRAHQDSDVDVGVLLDRETLPTPRQRFAHGTSLASRLMERLATGVDLVILNDLPPTFARRIVLDGVRVLCADSEADHAFVRDVQLRAADLEPFLRRMRAVKLDALAR